MENRICNLIKIGKREHIEDLQQKGILYLNHLSFFKEMEEDKERKDVHEGLERVDQVNWLKLRNENGQEIEIGKQGKKGNSINAQLRVENLDLMGNVYSMIGITTNLCQETDRLDLRNKDFGDSFLIINNSGEFIKRVENEIEKLGLLYSRGMVKYYDEKIYSGELGVFYKPNKFKHQNEFRIFVKQNHQKPLTIKIGSLVDISEICNIEELENFRFKYP